MASTSLGRGRTVLLALLLALVLPVAGASAAWPVTPEEDPAASAAAFLADSYSDHPDTFGFGISSNADLVFALAALGSGATTAQQALADLEASADSYLTTPGAFAKVLLAVLVAGGDPADFGGHALEAELRAALGDDGAFDPLAFNQAYAVLALSRTGGGVPEAAAAWLEDQQCDDGSVANDFDEDGAPDCPGDPDTTALAAQALTAAGRDASAAAAIDWLLANQAADGSFSNFGANPNSTGLAAQALRAAGRTDAAERAEAWVVSQQIGCEDAELAGAIASPFEGLQSVEFGTLQGVFAFDAPPLADLDLTSAAADAPTLTCAAAPAPDEEPSPAPSPAPTDGATDAPDPGTDDDVTDDAADDAEELPATGADDAWLLVVAAGLVMIGATSVRAGRRDR